MAAKEKAESKPAIDPERAAQIATDARSGTNWASTVNYGPACACGAFHEGATIRSWGQLIYKGACYRHETVRGSRHA